MAAREVIGRVCCLALLIQLVLVLEPLGSVGEDQLAPCCTDNDWMYEHDCNKSCSTNGMDRHCCCSGYSVNELDLCIVTDECAAGTHDCEHNCHNTPESYYCSCDEGYQLANDNRSCLNISECAGNCMPGTCVNTNGFYNCSDVDECLVDNGGCSHICNNTVGSYHCECYHGYRLGEDEHNCISVVDPHNTADISSALADSLIAAIVSAITGCGVIINIPVMVLCILWRRRRKARNELQQESHNSLQNESNPDNVIVNDHYDNSAGEHTYEVIGANAATVGPQTPQDPQRSQDPHGQDPHGQDPCGQAPQDPHGLTLQQDFQTLKSSSYLEVLP